MDDRELAQRLDTLEQLLTAVYAKLYPESVEKPKDAPVAGKPAHRPGLRPQKR